MITAEEFFRAKLKELQPFKEVITLSQELITAEQGMRWGYEYSIIKAKYYVEEALKQASEEVNREYTYAYSSERNFGEEVEKNILNAYPLDLIK